MDENGGDLEKDLVRQRRRLWGLRPWKRHSLILTVSGFLYVLVGFLYINTPSTPGRERALKVILQVAPVHVWGGIFMVAGALAIISSRWPPFAETWGYMVLTGLSSGWAATYLLGIMFFHSPVTNASQVAIWGCLAFMWWAISGLLNPDKSTVVKHERL